MQSQSDQPDVVTMHDQAAASQRARWTTPAPSVGAPRSGWRIFAATMIAIGGALNVIDGIVAVFDTHYYVTIAQTANGPHLVVTDSLNSWGWAAFATGIVMICTALAIVLTTTVGRVVGVVVAGWNLVFQLMFLPVFPLWALVMILIDVLVIYGLVARFEETPRTA